MDPCKISRLCPRTPTEVQIQGNLCRILFFGLGLPGGIAKQHKRAFFPLRCFSNPPFFLHRILEISPSNQQFLLMVSVERGGKSGQPAKPEGGSDLSKGSTRARALLRNAVLHSGLPVNLPNVWSTMRKDRDNRIEAWPRVNQLCMLPEYAKTYS